METKDQYLYTPGVKLKWWGEGEWVSEPDSITFEYEGYKCLVRRTVKEPTRDYAYGGHLCGYVQLPKSHPLYTFDYDDIPIECHGGLTFAEEGLIGFDCAHSDDYSPFYEKFKLENTDVDYLKVYLDSFKPTYKNVSFCIEECKSMVIQLMAWNLKHGK